MRRPLFPTFLLAAAALLAGAGCSSNALDTDPTLFVAATVKSATVNVDQTNMLVATLNGGFTLSLHLGIRASSEAEVNVQQFELVSEDQNTIIVPSLPLTAKGQTLPIVVEPGSDEDVPITIEATELKGDEGTKLCSFGSVRYRGSLTDSLRGGTVPVLVDPVDVTGCTP
jgi:hypothetical protein